MNKQVIFVTLGQYADWECAFLATALQDRIKDKTSDYEVKTLSVSGSPVKSIGGFTTLPDYSIETCPADFAALVLIGGTTWRTEEAKRIAPLVKRAFESGKPVGAICDATVFLGMNGLLNERRHTSNTLDDLTEAAKDSYTNSDNYVHEQAVRDANLITANGTGYLKFAREMLLALDAYPADYIESNYQFFKQGFIEIMKKMNG
jgi:putative intracellular protease/amidase